jgi:hypothetical protein
MMARKRANDGFFREWEIAKSVKKMNGIDRTCRSASDCSPAYHRAAIRSRDSSELRIHRHDLSDLHSWVIGSANALRGG